MSSTMNFLNPKFFIIISLIGLILFGIFYAVLDNPFSHGDTKHGDDAQTSRDCARQGGLRADYLRPDGRRIALCILKDLEGLAIRVFKNVNGKWEEVTAYVDWWRRTLGFDKAVGELVKYAAADGGHWGEWVYVCSKLAEFIDEGMYTTP